MKRLGWNRPAYSISKTYSVFDVKNVKAEIPPPGEFPLYEQRSMLVCEPITDVVHSNPDVLHEDTNCPNTLLAHKGVIKQAVGERWFLLIFKEPICNIHFAQSSTRTVETHDKLVVFDKDFDGNTVKEEVHFATATWDIAFEYGGQLVEEQVKAKKSHREMLMEKRAKKLAAAKALHELD